MEAQSEQKKNPAEALFEDMRRMILSRAEKTRYEEHDLDDRFVDTRGDLYDDIEVRYPGIKAREDYDGNLIGVRIPVERIYNRETVYIAVDLVTQWYGGPEEGGWYYDSGSVEEYECVVVLYENDAPFLPDHEIVFLRQLSVNWIDEYGEFGTRHRTSVRHRGSDFELRATFDEPEDWPRERQYYC
jgi:hypothetical protein